MASPVLSVLQGVDGYVTLGLKIGSVVIPLIKGLVKDIKSIEAGANSVTYQVVLESDGAELGQIIQMSADDLAAINAELNRLKGVGTAPPATPAAG